MSMLSTSRKKSRKVVAVIKNEHTKAQMSALDDEWAAHGGPCMTLAETLAYAAARTTVKPAVVRAGATNQIIKKTKLILMRRDSLVLRAARIKSPVRYKSHHSSKF